MPTRTSTLIICEGECTEPNYLDALAREFGLTGLSIPRNSKTDPMGLVKAAKDGLKGKASFDQAFVVIDKDDHPSYHGAIESVRQYRENDNRLEIFCSVPCFEVFLISHFEYTTAPFTKEGALAKLKALFPSYDKSDLSCMDEFIGRLATALENSERAYQQAVKNDEMNSSSNFFMLIRTLLGEM